jgi:hypothetical protein
VTQGLAIAACCLLLIGAGFQLALSAGAPWAAAAYGGRAAESDGRLPSTYRAAALNTAGNLAGRHPVERWGMGALTACLAVLCVLLAVR